jgi:hypothetical protein
MRMVRGATLVAVLAACGTGRPEGNGVATDSLGVRIVTSSVPAWREGGAWQVDSVPMQVAGDASRTDGALLVGVGGVHRFRDGRLAAVVGEDRQVIYFTAEGAVTTRIGGPDTFLRPRLIGTAGDSLWIWDAGNARLTVLDAAGAVVRTAVIAGALAPAGRFADGGLILTGRPTIGRGEGVGLRRDGIALFAADAGGEVVSDTLAIVPGTEMVVASTPDFVAAFPRPFGAQTSIAIADRWIQAVAGDGDEVLRITPEGRLGELWRLARPRRAIPLEEIREHGLRRTQQVAQLPRPVAERVADAMVAAGLPGEMPTFDQQVIDETGHTWLREDAGPERRDVVPQRWQVLAPDGAWLGSVVTPPGLAVWQVTRDHLVGVRRDPNGIEEVRVHRLRR